MSELPPNSDLAEQRQPLRVGPYWHSSPPAAMLRASRLRACLLRVDRLLLSDEAPHAMSWLASRGSTANLLGLFRGCATDVGRRYRNGQLDAGFCWRVAIAGGDSRPLTLADLLNLRDAIEVRPYTDPCVAP